MICTTLIIGGTQLVFIGLIGEYLTRVLDEVKRRPLYFFKQTPSVEKKPIRPTRRVIPTSDGDIPISTFDARQLQELALHWPE